MAIAVQSTKNGKVISYSFGRTFDISYSSSTGDDLLKAFRSSVLGLTSHEARKRIACYGHNDLSGKKKGPLDLLIHKFRDPLVIVLIVVASLSFYMGQPLSAGIVMGMAVISVLLSFFQEYKASREVEKLREMVRTTATVYRDTSQVELPIREIAPGDVVYLSAGDIVPADVRVISCKDLFINQSAITGESFPVEKHAVQIKSPDKSPSQYANIAFMGSNVVSGSALCLVLLTGKNTMFGGLARKVSETVQDTAFDKGMKEFAMLMIRFMLVLVVLIFAINAIGKGNVMEVLLFSLAVAVGLTPEMLPMIITVNLAKGAIALSKKKVIVKRLSAIQNLGSMDILCTDKTGTLTVGEVVLEKHLDINCEESEDVLFYAYANSYYQTGLKNLLDKAILKHGRINVSHVLKVDEIPFDFNRKIMSVVVNIEGEHILVAKGAPEEVINRCVAYELNGDIKQFGDMSPMQLLERFNEWRKDGFRVLAVAYRKFAATKHVYSKEDECSLVLKGIMVFLDPPKRTAKRVIKELNKSGIEVIILTGDTELITEYVCKKVGLPIKGLMTGEQLEKLSEEQLQEIVNKNTIFARLTPLQKERVILALKRNGHTVGYMGDGINDAPAMKASDVAISVDNAVDMAKESADIILLQKSLRVLDDGVMEGRRIFANILKYIRMGSSSNLGNMVSVTAASTFLPFLPMTSVQILVNNFLYDLSQLAIPTDSVDDELIKKPIPWDIKSIERFMKYIGPVSSIFDLLTFAVLVFMAVPQAVFHTVWFLESLCTQTLAIHVIRTSKVPFLESRPSRYMIITSLLIVSVGLILGLTPLGFALGFEVPSLFLIMITFLIVASYLVALQFAKSYFVRKFGY